MKRTSIVVVTAAVFAAASAGMWFLVSEKCASQERRETFFGSTKELPTTGGQKMKPEW